MKRRVVAESAAATVHALPEPKLKGFTSLTEWMTAARYDDGTPRTAPSLTIWAQAGQWKLSLKDRDGALVMWLCAGSLLEVFQLADAFCQSDDAPWRHDEWASEQKGKRVKK